MHSSISIFNGNFIDFFLLRELVCGRSDSVSNLSYYIEKQKNLQSLETERNIAAGKPGDK
jgi:hypothetical protein